VSFTVTAATSASAKPPPTTPAQVELNDAQRKTTEEFLAVAYPSGVVRLNML